MSETPTQSVFNPPTSMGSPETVMSLRDQKLQELLGTDYEFAQDEGLIDIFRYDPETGEDGLMHLLAGNVEASPEGKLIAMGYHHGPSPAILQAAGLGGGDTRVLDIDTTPMGWKERRNYQRDPYEAYRAPVEIAGLPKLTVSRNGSELKPVDNSMYPDEYDPLTVLRIVKFAHDNRDVSQDTIVERPGGFRIVNNATAPMLDGEHQMKIRLVMDESGKIITAIPNQRTNIMKLTRTDVKQHLGLS